EKYNAKTMKQSIQTHYKESGLLKDWSESMDIKDIWRMQHPQDREYSRYPYMVNPDPEVVITPKRIDYIMVNSNMAHHITDSKIINNSTLNWKSDHGILEMEMVGMPIIKEASKNVFQRPMWQTRKMTEEAKISFQNHINSVIVQDIANSNTEWIELGVENWMKENLVKTSNRRGLSLHVTREDYKERKQILKTINTVLGSKEEERIENIGIQIIETYKNKMDTEEKNVKCNITAELEKWDREKRILEIKDYRWIVIEWKRKIISQMNNIEKQEIERKRGLTMEKIRKGQRYAPWAGVMWKACKPYKRTDMGIPVLMGDGGEILTGKEKDKHIANFMNKQWGTAHRNLKVIPDNLILEQAPEELMNELLNSEITIAEVRRVIKGAKANKGPGPDLIPYEVWKLGNSEVQEYIRKMFEYMRTGQFFPDSWKESDIKWIYKKGNQLNMANYRPIALSNTISKLFIRILTDRLMKLTEAARLIRDEQQGFRPDRSCSAAVLILKTLLARATIKKEPMYMACLDISKAYDNVNHQRLWEICEKMGIKGEWLDCMKELYKDNKIRGIGSKGMT
ncbi:MAG: RNA-directed DNA polymerase, partial [Deltaproteobacteria bacterium]|nr:RNA-directed DNA polymerase [Deltaproteobacteria bacterium]